MLAPETRKYVMIITRRKVAYLLRKVHLLQFVDKLLFVREFLKNRKSNQLFLTEHPDFVPPPAYLAYDAYNHTNWRGYYDMGRKHSSLISELVKKYVNEKELKICEWGCGPARVIRHLEKIEGFEKIELYGIDYNEKSINWCNKNIKNIRFLKNRLEPPLPIEDEMFDCVYAISIFTHLSERMHYAWIKELFRVLKPNGIIIFTTHGDTYAERLSSADKARYDSGLLVIRDKVKEGKKLFLVFHPPQFIKNNLLKNYVVIEHINNPASYNLEQEVWVAKKC